MTEDKNPQQESSPTNQQPSAATEVEPVVKITNTTPGSTPAGAMPTNSGISLKIVIIIVVVLLVLVISAFVLGLSLQTKAPGTTTPTPTNPDQTNAQPTDVVNQGTATPTAAFSYKVYEDDYVRFEYPSIASVEVEDGVIKNVADQTDFIGVSSIKITLSAGNSLEVFYPLLGRGCTSIRWNSASPLILETSAEEGAVDQPAWDETSLTKTPYLKKLDKYSVYVLGVPDSQSIHFGSLGGTQFTAGCSDIYILQNYPVMGGTGTFYGTDVSEMGDSSIITPLCKVSDENAFNNCIEYMNHFFNTAVRK